MDVSDVGVEQRARREQDAVAMWSRGRAWGGAVIAGFAAVGWLWVGLRFSSALSELAARQSAIVFAVLVAVVFFAGAVPGFFVFRDRRRVRVKPARRGADDDQTIPAPPPSPPRAKSVRAAPPPVDLETADTVPPAGPTPPAADDKEYF